MQMIAEIFSRICARTARLPGKIDSLGVDITNCQNDNRSNPLGNNVFWLKRGFSTEKILSLLKRDKAVRYECR